MLRFIKARLASLLDGLLALMVVGSVVAIGAVHAQTAVVLAALTITFSLLVVAGSVRHGLPPRPPALFWALLLACLWAAVQCLPVLTPFAGSVSTLWEMSGSHPARLTGNLPATALMSLKVGAGAATLAVAFYYFHHSDRIDRLVNVVIAAGAIAIGIGVVQSWLGSDRVLFFYEPAMGPVRDGLRGPFVNPDHLGAYAALAAVLAVGRGVVLRAERVRHVYQAAAVFLVTGVFLSYSASAALGLTAGLLFLGFAYRRQRTRVASPFGVTGPILVAAACLSAGAIIAAVVPGPIGAFEAQAETLGRLPEIWGASLSLAVRNPVVGIGGGTLPDLMGMELSLPAVRVWYARNQALQLVLDFGLPVAGVVLTALAAALARLRLAWHTEDIPSMVPVSAALTCLVAISTVDFALEIPAIGLVFILLLGALLRQAHRYRSRPRKGVVVALLRRLGRHPAIAVSTASFLLVPAGLAALMTQNAYQERITALEDSVIELDQAASSDALVEAAHAVLRMRPGDGRTFALVGAVLLARGEVAVATTWLETAHRLLPLDAATTLMRALAALEGDELALADRLAREAIELDERQRQNLARHLLLHSDEIELWESMTAQPETRQALADELLEEGRNFEALAFASHLLAADPADLLGLELAAQAAIELRLFEAAYYYAHNLERADPQSVVANLARAAVDMSEDRPDEALGRIEAALSRAPDDHRVWLALGNLLVEMAESGPVPADYASRLEGVREQVRADALTDSRVGRAYHWMSARFYASVGQWTACASAARQGLEVSPDNPYFHLILAMAQEELGAGDEAAQSRARAGQLDPSAIYPPISVTPEGSELDPAGADPAGADPAGADAPGADPVPNPATTDEPQQGDLDSSWRPTSTLESASSE